MTSKFGSKAPEPKDLGFSDSEGEYEDEEEEYDDGEEEYEDEEDMV